MDNISSRLLHMRTEEHHPKGPKLLLEHEIEVLKGVLHSFQTVHQFTVGMIVRQKLGCAYINLLGNNKIGIVVEILPTPIVESIKDSSSAYFRQPLDMLVGCRPDDGDFAIFHVDSRRFEPVERGGESTGK